MTRLRKMTLEELQRRNYSTITTRNYLWVVTEFAKYFGKPPDRLGLNELRTYHDQRSGIMWLGSPQRGDLDENTSRSVLAVAHWLSGGRSKPA